MNKFPVLISGEIARPFAESIATKVGLVPPGIDISKFYPLDIDKKWDVLYIGHLYREKGVLFLLDAMKWLKNNGSPLKLKIIHTPSGEEKIYHRYIRENELTNVDMERAIIAEHISVYNSARVFMYPGISYNRVATTPLTILEASACGLPVVCTSLYRHIGLPNITFTDPDAKSLASALLQAASHSNPKTCDEAVAIIREKYSLTNMGSIAESFFTEVVDGK
jgi:glycosyltransferase involved in cell wall biosynthesis